MSCPQIQPIWARPGTSITTCMLCRLCAEARGVVKASQARPSDAINWLEANGWTRVATLRDIAQRWTRQDQCVTVPLLPSSPDFQIRWDEMLNRLGVRADDISASTDVRQGDS